MTPLRNLLRRRRCDPKLPPERERQESESSDSSFSSLGTTSTLPKSRSWPLFESLLEMAEKISRSFILLYAGYGISCIGDRLWTFAIVFILERLGGMRLVSVNQFIEAISAMLLSTYVGNWMDRHDRRYGTLSVLAVNNVSVAVSAFMLLVCLSLEAGSSWLYCTCITLSIVFCAFSKCASEAERFSFTKDWIVVLTKRDDSGQLSARNATMTVIDQLSSVIAPIITGYSLCFMGYQGACFFFVACNLVFWVVERALLAKVYQDVEELHVREKTKDETVEREIELLTQEGRLPVYKRMGKMVYAYWQQSVCTAAFGLALLYMTVLGFDGLAISHAKSQGLPDDVIGWFRSAGSALGIAGAFSYTISERHNGVRTTGVIGMLKWWSHFTEAFAANPPDAPIQLTTNITVPPLRSSISSDIDWTNLTMHGNSMVSVLVFLTGLTLARLGLWMTDLCITQLMQESIPEEERGTVFGVQNALCQFFSVLKDVIVIVFPDPRTFGFLIGMSVFFVTLGFISFCIYLVKTVRCNNPSTGPNGRLQKAYSIQELQPLKGAD